MKETAFFNGVDISCDDLDSALMERGLSEDKIGLIRMRAYQTACCEELDSCNAAHPVIDYGDPKVLYYEGMMPALSEYYKAFPKRYVWKFCPFCGRPTTRIIHPESQTSIDGTY